MVAYETPFFPPLGMGNTWDKKDLGLFSALISRFTG